MTLEIQLENTCDPPGLSIHICSKKPEPENVRRLYIFGPNALSQHGEGQKNTEIMNAIFSNHIGEERRHTTLVHLGAPATAIFLGEPSENNTEQRQKATLADFMKDLPRYCGAYGPWWQEVFSMIQSPKRADYKNRNCEIFLFQDTPSRAPHGWNKKQFLEWVKLTNSLYAAVRFVLITREDGVAFCNDASIEPTPSIKKPLSINNLRLQKWLEQEQAIFRANVGTDAANLNFKLTLKEELVSKDQISKKYDWAVDYDDYKNEIRFDAKNPDVPAQGSIPAGFIRDLTEEDILNKEFIK